MKAKSWRVVHSPWLFKLLTAMRRRGEENDDIEQLRMQLRGDGRHVPVMDFGAGSTGDIRTVSGIARRALKRPKHARAIAALASHIRAAHVLELGTSLGITTAHLARASAAVWTLEGNPHIAQIAQAQWHKLNLENIHCITGPFEETFATALRDHGPFDLIFIDGNHRGEALERYVHQSLPHLSPKGVIICDDIHWSSDMENSWRALCNAPNWTLCADFYEWGLLTQNSDLKPEVRAIRF